MPPPPQRPRSSLLTIFALWAVFFCSFTLLRPALLDDADSVHAEVAREMLLRHDPITLYANGIRYLEKAPVLYWSMALSMRVSQLLGHPGPRALATAARIPLAFTVLALALLTEAFARRAFRNARAGLYAALILLSSPGVFLFTRILLPDAMVCLWLTLALYAFLLTEPASAPAQAGVPHSSRSDGWGSTTATPPQTMSFRPDPGPAVRAVEKPASAPAPAHGTGDTTQTVSFRPERSAAEKPASAPAHSTGDTTQTVSFRPERSAAEKPASAPAHSTGDTTQTVSFRPERSAAEKPASAPAQPTGTAPLTPCLLFAAACALNVLTKGLIGIVSPVAIVLLYLLLTRGLRGTLRRLRQLHPLTSLAVFLAIAAPWHILIALANPTQGHPGPLTFTNHHWSVPLPSDGNVHGWLWFYFVNEQLLRYLNLRVPRDYDTVPLYLFWGLCLIWLMPWSAYVFKSLGTVKALVRTLPRALQHWKHPGYTRQLRALLNRPNPQFLLTLWAAFVLLFFLFSTRQEYYVLPAIPALAILIAGWLSLDSRITWQPNTAAAKLIRRANLRITLALAILGALFALAALTILLRTHPPAPNTDLASLLQQNPGDYAMSMGHFLDLNAQALGLFRLPLSLAAASLFLGPLAAFLLRKNNRPHPATLALAAGAFGFLLAAHLGLQTFAPVLSSAQLAQAIRPYLRPCSVPRPSSLVIPPEHPLHRRAPADSSDPAQAAPSENLSFRPEAQSAVAEKPASAPAQPTGIPNPCTPPLIVIHQEYEFASTLGFYLQLPTYTQPTTDNEQRTTPQNPIHILTDPTYNNTPSYGRSSNLWYGSFFPAAPPIFETAQSLAAQWNAPRRIFLWQDLGNQPSPPPPLPGPVYIVLRSGGKALLTNHPLTP